MTEKILVTYASKYGGTAQIAEKIAEVIMGAGLQVDLLQIKQVKEIDSYQGVVVGSAVYLGKWRKEVVKFLKVQAERLSAVPVWIFSSGPTGEGDPVELLEGWKYPKELQPSIDQIEPRDIALFHGAVDLEQLNMIEKKMVEMVESPLGDFRDWDQISNWAEAIAQELKIAG